MRVAQHLVDEIGGEPWSRSARLLQRLLVDVEPFGEPPVEAAVERRVVETRAMQARGLALQDDQCMAVDRIDSSRRVNAGERHLARRQRRHAIVHCAADGRLAFGNRTGNDRDARDGFGLGQLSEVARHPRSTATLRASSPIASSVGASASRPRSETSPHVGFQALTPQAWAGIRNEPPVSDPTAATTDPLATAAAEPDEEPPATKSGFQGFARGRGRR